MGAFRRRAHEVSEDAGLREDQLGQVADSWAAGGSNAGVRSLQPRVIRIMIARAKPQIQNKGRTFVLRAMLRRSCCFAAASLFLLPSVFWGQDARNVPPLQALTAQEKEKQAFKTFALRQFVEVDSKTTNGAAAVLRVFVPAGEGAAPHVHSREDEVFEVVRGHYRFRHGEHEVDAPVGTIVFMPRGIPHLYRNIANEPGEHVLTLIPGGLENMFREVSSSNLELPRDIDKYAEIALKYGVTLLPPTALQLSSGP